MKVKELGSGDRQRPEVAAVAGGRRDARITGGLDLEAVQAIGGWTGVAAERKFHKRRVIGAEPGRPVSHGTHAWPSLGLVGPELDDLRVDPHLVDRSG